MISARIQWHRLQEARNSGSRWFVPGLAGLILLSPLIHGQLNRTARGRNIVYPEYYEKAVLSHQQTNQLKGRMTLAEGEYLTNGWVLGKTMQLDQYHPDGSTNLVARAPECLFDPSTRAAWSTGRLEIVAMNGRFLMWGNEGFTANLTNTTLTLSNRVRTILKQSLMKPLSPLP